MPSVKMQSGTTVRRAISSALSNEQTEGRITKRKLISCQMNGRGNLDLLQARVIAASRSPSPKLGQGPDWAAAGPTGPRPPPAHAAKIRPSIPKNVSGIAPGCMNCGRACGRKRSFLPNIALEQALSRQLWRREWDSNPRYACAQTRFPSVRLQPLGHLSNAN